MFSSCLRLFGLVPLSAAFEGIIAVVLSLWDVIVSVYDLVRAIFAGDFKQVWFRFRDMIGEVIGFIVELI